jgi:hypothetical protein
MQGRSPQVHRYAASRVRHVAQGLSAAEIRRPGGITGAGNRSSLSRAAKRGSDEGGHVSPTTIVRGRPVKLADILIRATLEAERLVASTLTQKPQILDADLARDRDRERIRLLHSALARRRLRSIGSRFA